MQISLERWRGQIDVIDRTLVELLNRRAMLALEAGERKREAGLGLRDLKREKEILARARERNAGPLDSAAVGRLFRAILMESRRAQWQAIENVRRSGRSRCA